MRENVRMQKFSGQGTGSCFVVYYGVGGTKYGAVGFL